MGLSKRVQDELLDLSSLILSDSVPCSYWIGTSRDKGFAGLKPLRTDDVNLLSFAAPFRVSWVIATKCGMFQNFFIILDLYIKVTANCESTKLCTFSVLFSRTWFLHEN